MGPISPILQDLTLLLAHADPAVRVAGARLAAALDVASLRRTLAGLAQTDPDPAMREAADTAVARLTPDGGRGGEIVRTHGGFANLRAHEAAEIVYDATVVFCDRFIDRRSRTHDQMVQAARSGKQNIVEGSAAAGTSSKTELRLIGVARASFEELLADYRDFLRQRRLAQWSKDHPQTQEIRRLAYQENRTYKTYRPYFEEAAPEVAANAAICLTCQATYLLDRLIQQLERTFIEHGGISERMLAARLRHRESQQQDSP